MRLALTETLQQRAHLREERHCKTGRRLVAKRDDPLCVEIHITASERRGFSLSKPCKAEEFQKICTVLRIGIELLAPYPCDDALELLERRRKADWFLPFG